MKIIIKTIDYNANSSKRLLNICYFQKNKGINFIQGKRTV